VPFFVLVTDLVSTHSLWYHPDADLTLVPTVEARKRAVRNGVQPNMVEVTGLPVGSGFSEPVRGRQEYRHTLGWPQDVPMVLLVGGGEGMGPLSATARAIAGLDCKLGLAVVAGRNQDLERELKSARWEIPVFIYGFEQRIPQMMRAADILVTKAGPGTITEAINAHLPLVLYSRLPGQEDGNVEFVIEHELGVWAPDPGQAAQAVRRWVLDPESLRAAALRCAEVARPDAGNRIAEVIALRLGVGEAISVRD
jgi:1,2-diacylglycerol 3-beta-galactosyltransferase